MTCRMTLCMTVGISFVTAILVADTSSGIHLALESSFVIHILVVFSAFVLIKAGNLACIKDPRIHLMLKPLGLMQHLTDVLKQIQHPIDLSHTFFCGLAEVCHLRKYNNNCLAKQVVTFLFSKGIFRHITILPEIQV